MSFYDNLVLEAQREPQSREFKLADDIFIKAIRFDEHKPSVGNQHMHKYEHVSVVLGPFAVHIGDEEGIRDDAEVVLLGGPGQPMMITIEAHKFHRFVSLAPGGILLCIHNTHGAHRPIVQKPAPPLR